MVNFKLFREVFLQSEIHRIKLRSFFIKSSLMFSGSFIRLGLQKTLHMVLVFLNFVLSKSQETDIGTDGKKLFHITLQRGGKNYSLVRIVFQSAIRYFWSE